MHFLGDDSSRVGDVLAGKYELLERLGAGGTATVYRARNMLVGREVAIKLLRRDRARDPQLVERFIAEARTANLVRHPHVVDVLDIGRDDGVPFLVQELLLGEDLGEHLAARPDGRLGLEECFAIFLPVVDAIAAAHAQRVVHRDLKPENVFLARDAGGGVTAKVLDFGISKLQAEPLAPRRSHSGVVIGTPAYMSPERFADPRAVGAPADVWALGVMLYEMLTGALPFVASNHIDLFLQITRADAPRVRHMRSEVSAALDAVVARCLARDPAERFADAAELLRALQSIELSARPSARAFARELIERHCTQRPARAHVASPPASAQAERARTHRRWPRPALVVAAATALAVLTGIGLGSALPSPSGRLARRHASAAPAVVASAPLTRTGIARPDADPALHFKP